MSTPPIVRDYFAEFSKLVQNQRSCALLLCDFFSAKDTLRSEKEMLADSKRHMREILWQKNERLLPNDKERICFALSELIFQSQLTLLHIPELFRIYGAEQFLKSFECFLPTVTRCCNLLSAFALPPVAKDRFQKCNAEPIFDCCLEGFRRCVELDLSKNQTKNQSFEFMILKDIDEEFASFFLINLKFTHLALHFPM